jgi:enterochelin esterase family protein
MKRILIICAAALMTLSLSAQEWANFSFGGARKPSPEFMDGKVAFRYTAPNANAVTLNGSWQGGRNVAMTKGENGIWEVIIDTPAPEIYTYTFSVDGVSVSDPQNVLVQRDGSRFLTMLIVPGEFTENYFESKKQHGTVLHPWYSSKIMATDNRRLTVYLPAGYFDNPQTRYPVLYLMHGAGGDEEAWISMGRAAQILDNLIEKGLAKPMIVVMPNTNNNQYAAQTLGIPNAQIAQQQRPQGGQQGGQRPQGAPQGGQRPQGGQQGGGQPNPYANAYERSLAEEIVPFIEKNFRVIANPDNRAIAGLSMGGGNTYTCSTMYPDMFRYIAPFSAAIFGDMDKVKLQAIKDAGCKLYFIACGSADSLISTSDNLDKALTEIGLKHTYMVTEGGHTWANWRLYLNTLAPLLFK